jgi:ubiquinone/menaquinone biosynthesis C-methylase UbiE
MTEIKVTFDDGAAYERFMGRWSRAIGEKFLAWVAPPANARWLDVGCGTGAFTQLVLQHCSPQSIVGVDPSAAQIEHARKQSAAKKADFRVADAMALPFPDGGFDVVASALVINFIPDPAKALCEMRRVVRQDGTVAAYLWDRSATSEFAPYAPMARALHAIGAEVLRSPVVAESTPEGLKAALDAAGFSDIVITKIEASQSYRDFDDYWQAQTPPFAPPGKSVAALTDDGRIKLREILRAALPAAPDGTITYSARAVAFKARKPK